MWYSNYIDTLNKSLDDQDVNVLDVITKQLAKCQSDEPTATIAIIAFNEEKRILPCIWSLCNNITNFPFEIICVNNASTDRTEELFKRIGARYFNEERKSAGFARQKALEEARGKYYFCIDADTLYPPDYIQIMVGALQKKGISAVSSQYNFIPEPGISRLKLSMYELFRNINSYILSVNRPELTVRGSVFAFVTEYGRKEGFRVNIKRGEDGAMASELKKYGRIKLVRCKKARAFTSAAPLKSDGGLAKALFKRILSALSMLSVYLTQKSKYEDKGSNLINKKEE